MEAVAPGWHVDKDKLYDDGKQMVTSFDNKLQYPQLDEKEMQHSFAHKPMHT